VSSKSYIKKGVVGFFIVLFLLWTLFPFFWMFSISVKKEIDVLAVPPKVFSISTFQNYRELISDPVFIKYFVNSIVIGLSATFLSLLIGLPGAYVISRFQFSGRRTIDFMVLMTRMTPPVVVLIPYFLVFRYLKLIDTHLAVVAMHLTLNLSLVIWVSKGFFAEIPASIEESALVDGSSYWGVFFRIIIPISLPLIATLSVLCFLFSWNEFLFALALTNRNAITAPVAISKFMSYEKMHWGRLMASSILIIIPSVIFIAITQKGLIRGLTFGAIKE